MRLNFLQLSTKLQDLKKKMLKLQRCWGNAQFKAAHTIESDVHYCMKANMVKSSSQLCCQHSPIYYKGRLVQHFHYLVHVVNLANAIHGIQN